MRSISVSHHRTRIPPNSSLSLPTPPSAGVPHCSSLLSRATQSTVWSVTWKARYTCVWPHENQPLSLSTLCTCPRVCGGSQGDGGNSTHGWRNESCGTIVIVPSRVPPPAGDWGAAATKSCSRVRRDVWLCAIHRTEWVRRCRAQVFEPGDGSPQNLSLFCHNSSEQQLHLQPTLPACTPTGQCMTFTMPPSYFQPIVGPCRSLVQDLYCVALWCFVLILLSVWMLQLCSWRTGGFELRF